MKRPTAEPRRLVLAAARELVARTTEAQGLPAVITDPIALERIAAMFKSSTKAA